MLTTETTTNRLKQVGLMSPLSLLDIQRTGILIPHRPRADPPLFQSLIPHLRSQPVVYGTKLYSQVSISEPSSYSRCKSFYAPPPLSAGL